MSTPTPDVIALWYHYEEIAMHFNTLIIQFRLQLIGGAGVLGTLSAYLIGATKIENDKERRHLRSVVATGLLTLLVAAAILDLGYYNRLLSGAVIALIAFERDHPEIQMSTSIANNVGRGIMSPWFAYGLMILVLGTFMTWSWFDFRKHS